MKIEQRNLENGWVMKQLDQELLRSFVVVMDDGSEWMISEDQPGILEVRAGEPYYTGLQLRPVTSNVIEVWQKR